MRTHQLSKALLRKTKQALSAKRLLSTTTTKVHAFLLKFTSGFPTCSFLHIKLHLDFVQKSQSNIIKVGSKFAWNLAKVVFNAEKRKWAQLWLGH